MSVAPSSVLDIADLLNRVDDDRELLAELFSIFKSVAPVHLQRLSEAVTLEQVKSVQSESHTLKGMLLNLSAARAASVATHLESLGKAQEVKGMAQAFSDLQAEVDLLVVQMNGYTAGPKP